MRSAFRSITAACVIAAAFSVSRADDAASTGDPILVHLNDAKAVNTKAKKQAADVLHTATDNAIKSAASKKQADQVALLESQLQAFTANGTVPSALEIKKPVEDYREAIVLADANLDRAFSRAVRHYAAEGHSEKALQIEQEKSRLHQERAAAEATAKPDAANLANPAGAQPISQAIRPGQGPVSNPDQRRDEGTDHPGRDSDECRDERR